MTRQHLLQHVEQALDHGEATKSTSDLSATLCQHCGRQIESDKKESLDDTELVIHQVPSHGTDETNHVIYCGSSCFTEAMDALFDTN